jgi:hypothetical protein
MCKIYCELCVECDYNTGFTLSCDHFDPDMESRESLTEHMNDTKHTSTNKIVFLLCRSCTITTSTECLSAPDLDLERRPDQAGEVQRERKHIQVRRAIRGLDDGLPHGHTQVREDSIPSRKYEPEQYACTMARLVPFFQYTTEYDDFFAAFSGLQFGKCMQYQDAANEAPFYPADAAGGLGKADRRPTDNYVSTGAGVAVTDEGM